MARKEEDLDVIFGLLALLTLKETMAASVVLTSVAYGSTSVLSFHRETSQGLSFLTGYGLDLRQICVVCGFLIVACALGVGVGVPIALEIQNQQRPPEEGDLVRKLLAEVPLIDG